MENRPGRMVLNMRATGKTTRPMERVGFSTLTEMSMKETGMKTRRKATVFTFISMELDTKANGLKISNVVLARKLGLMAQPSKATMKMESSMAKAITFGQMALNITGSGTTTKLTGMVCIPGLMVGRMMVSGKPIICMERESISGPTEESMKATTEMTKSMDMENILGSMGESTLASGSTASRMEREPL